MAVWLFGCAAFQFNPRTPFGVQCPTAAVQTVSEPIRDCCGKLVGFKERAPKPGEAAFVQCRCAEKKATAHDLSLPPKLEPFFVEAARLELPAALSEPSAPPFLCEDVTVLPIPPSVRPPDAA